MLLGLLKVECRQTALRQQSGLSGAERKFVELSQTYPLAGQGSELTRKATNLRIRQTLLF